MIAVCLTLVLAPLFVAHLCPLGLRGRSGAHGFYLNGPLDFGIVLGRRPPSRPGMQTYCAFGVLVGPDLRRLRNLEVGVIVLGREFSASFFWRCFINIEGHYHRVPFWETTP